MLCHEPPETSSSKAGSMAPATGGKLPGTIEPSLMFMISLQLLWQPTTLCVRWLPHGWHLQAKSKMQAVNTCQGNVN